MNENPYRAPEGNEKSALALARNAVRKSRYWKWLCLGGLAVVALLASLSVIEPFAAFCLYFDQLAGVGAIAALAGAVSWVVAWFGQC
jgi:hypothetical protein